MRTSRTYQFIEPLELRRMLATFAGTGGNDTIAISVQAGGGMTIVQINGVSNFTADTEITVNAGNGDDLFRVFNTRVGVLTRLRGEGGNDTCENPNTLDLDAVYNGPTFFFGGTGFDVYFADNRNDTTAAASIDISRTAITRGTDGAVSLFDEIEHLEYRDNNSSNRISFSNIQDSTREITTIAINANGGNDTITNIDSTLTFGSWSTCMGSGGAFVDGGSGTDTLLLNNHNGGPGNHTLTASRITVTAAGSDAGPLDYVGIEAIDFDVTSTTPGSADDVIRLHSKPAATTLNFHAGDGDDEFIVGNGDLDSNGWQLVTLVGGNGTDSIIFDDELDTSSDGTSSAYTLAAQSLTKGTQVINYSGFESQTLKSANGFVSGFNTVPVVNLNATASTMQSTIITGGAARGCTVNVGNGSFGGLFGTINLNLHGGFFDRATISDSTAGGLANGYQVTDAFVRKGATNQTINYSGVSQMTVSTSTVFDSVSVDSTPADMTLSVLTNGGNDILTFGGGEVDARIRGPVTMDGGAGTNTAAIFNTDDTTLESQTLNGATFIDGFSHTFNSFSSLTINEGPGGTNLAVDSVIVPATINGGSGDEVVSIGNGSLASGLGANVTFNGAGGNDGMLLLGQNDSGTNTYAFPSFNQFRFGDLSTGKFVTFSEIEQATLRSGIGGDTIDVTTVPMPLSIFAGAGNDAVTVSASTAPVTVDTGAEQAAPFGFRQGDSLSIGFVSTFPASVVVEQDDTVIGLSVIGASTLQIANGAVIRRGPPQLIDFGLNLTGTIDLGGGALLWQSGGSTPDFRSFLTRGRNNGSWDGTNASINSSRAAASTVGDGVGYGLGSEIAINSIGPFAVQPGDTLLRYTLDGDANLDRQVNLNDFNRLASNFGATGAVWARGDFNYDAAVNLADFNALAGNFGQAIAATTTGHGSGARDEDLGIRLEELS